MLREAPEREDHEDAFRPARRHTIERDCRDRLGSTVSDEDMYEAPPKRHERDRNEEPERDRMATRMATIVVVHARRKQATQDRIRGVDGQSFSIMPECRRAAIRDNGSLEKPSPLSDPRTVAHKRDERSVFIVLPIAVPQKSIRSSPGLTKLECAASEARVDRQNKRRFPNRRHVRF